MIGKENYTLSRVLVRYAETDQMGVVYHTNFLIWFEVGRTEYIRERSTSYRSMEEKGVYLPILESHCRIRASARFEDALEVRTWIDEMKTRRVIFAYEVRRGDKVLAQGSTVHICLNENRQLIRIPEWVREGLISDPGSPAS
jgi:acyl-CoA thioester hydrolase